MVKKNEEVHLIVRSVIMYVFNCFHIYSLFINILVLVSACCRVFVDVCDVMSRDGIVVLPGLPVCVCSSLGPPLCSSLHIILSDCDIIPNVSCCVRLPSSPVRSRWFSASPLRCSVFQTPVCLPACLSVCLSDGRGGQLLAAVPAGGPVLQQHGGDPGPGGGAVHGLQGGHGGPQVLLSAQGPLPAPGRAPQEDPGPAVWWVGSHPW